MGELRNPLPRHAVGASQIAPVGDGEPQVVDAALEPVNEWSMHGGNFYPAPVGLSIRNGPEPPGWRLKLEKAGAPGAAAASRRSRRAPPRAALTFNPIVPLCQHGWNARRPGRALEAIWTRSAGGPSVLRFRSPPLEFDADLCLFLLFAARAVTAALRRWFPFRRLAPPVPRQYPYIPPPSAFPRIPPLHRLALVQPPRAGPRHLLWLFAAPSPCVTWKGIGSYFRSMTAATE